MLSIKADICFRLYEENDNDEIKFLGLMYDIRSETIMLFLSADDKDIFIKRLRSVALTKASLDELVIDKKIKDPGMLEQYRKYAGGIDETGNILSGDKGHVFKLQELIDRVFPNGEGLTPVLGADREYQ